MNEYIFNCNNGTLIKEVPNSPIKNIKITALIPVYNADKTILGTIR